MALPKRQMRDFTELNMIYKAHRTNVWWTMKVFWLHWYILISCFCTQPLKLWNYLTAIYYLILYFPFLYFWLALTGQIQDLCFSTIWLITKMEWFTVNKEVSKPYDYRYDCGQWTTSCDVIAILTVYPKKYAHGLYFAVLCCGYTLTDFPISIRLTSLALWQSNDCPSASKATLMNMDKYFMWMHYERLHNHNKAKHNKTVCIFLGIYCICKRKASGKLFRKTCLLWMAPIVWCKIR